MSRFWIVTKIAVSSALLWYLSRMVDFGAIGKALSALDVGIFVIGLLHLLLVPLLGGLRWGTVLSAFKTPQRLLVLVELSWIGMLLSQVLPSAAGGDAVKIWLAWRRGFALREATNSIILERILMVLSLLLMAAVLERFLPVHVDRAVTFWILPALLAAGIGGVSVLMVIDRVSAYLPNWAFVKVLSQLSQDAKKAFLSKYGFGLAILCILTHLNLSVATWWLSKALHLDVGLLNYIAIVPIVTLATLIPISIGGWGVREGAMVFLLAQAGVVADSAIALSVLFGACLILTGLPGLPLFLLASDRGKQANALFGAIPGEPIASDPRV